MLLLLMMSSAFIMSNKSELEALSMASYQRKDYKFSADHDRLWYAQERGTLSSERYHLSIARYRYCVTRITVIKMEATRGTDFTVCVSPLQVLVKVSPCGIRFRATQLPCTQLRLQDIHAAHMHCRGLAVSCKPAKVSDFNEQWIPHGLQIILVSGTGDVPDES
jgi:hypothetical protein